MFKFVSFSNITAGLIVVVIGFTGSVAIIFQAAAALNASPQEITSWIFALSLAMGLSCIGFSLYYRMPILTAWSTPGAALLATSLTGVSLPEAIGAFLFSAGLIILSGVTGLFSKAMNYIPRSLAAAMLSGILLHFGIDIFTAMQHQFLLVGSMLLTYLIGKRLFPRSVIVFVLLVGVLFAYREGLFHLDHVHLAFSSLIFTAPVFSLPTLISVGLPLFVVTMTSQNVPGITVLNAAGYRPPISSVITWTGIINFLLAPFGGYSLNLAAITAAICASKEADQDPNQRYKAAICAGVFYLIAGLLGATIVALFAAFPKALVLSMAGLALLGTIGNSLKAAIEEETQREPAMITLLVTASGFSLFGIGSACWGLVAGLGAFLLLNQFNKNNRIPELSSSSEPA